MAIQKNSHIIQLPQTPTPPPNKSINPWEITKSFLGKLESILASNDAARLQEVFHQESWWRDMLALTWDFRTVHTLPRIQYFVGGNQSHARLSSFRAQDKGKFMPTLETPSGSHQLSWISSMFFFETCAGHGSGVLRLTQDDAGAWKAYTLYTSLQDIKGVREPLGTNRVSGILHSMPGGERGGNWLERRKRQIEFLDEEPTVLAIGAGKCTF